MEKALDSGSSKIKDTNSSKNKSEMLVKCGVSWEYPCGFVWPPRYYKCSFCRREFKSAQALGGHMNVHRRERAKLRDHSSSSSSSSSICPNSWLSSRAKKHETPFSNPNPNPANPTNPSSLPPSSVYTHQYSMVSLSLSCLSSSAAANPIMASSTCPSSFKGSFSSAIDLDHHEEEYDEGKVVKLDLELGQVRETKNYHDHDLDLELTLGSRRS